MVNRSWGRTGNGGRYIIGRVLQDFFNGPGTAKQCTLEQSLSLYHSIRYPRSQKVQTTSREAGDLYEMKADEVKGLRYDEGLPIVKAMIEHRMSWIWTEDIDKVYEQARNAQHRAYASL